MADELKGEVPVGFVVTTAGVERSEDEIVQTRSGKILRGTVKRMADGVPYTAPATIDDPAILEETAERLRALGYPHGTA